MLAYPCSPLSTPPVATSRSHGGTLDAPAAPCFLDSTLLLLPPPPVTRFGTPSEPVLSSDNMSSHLGLSLHPRIDPSFSTLFPFPLPCSWAPHPALGDPPGTWHFCLLGPPVFPITLYHQDIPLPVSGLSEDRMWG